MNDEELELVTAYLDGEATPSERARVEADSELLAEVERQRTVRDLLHDVEPPSDAARESALAAALAVFDHEFATAAPDSPDAVTAPTNIVAFQQRRRLRWMQSLGAAAAVAAVAVAGAVIATRGGDDDSTADEIQQVTSEAGDTDALDNAAPAPPAAPAEATDTTSNQAILMAAQSTEVQSAADEAADPEAADAAVATTQPTAGAVSGEAPPTTQVPTAALPSPTSTRYFVVRTTDDLLELAEMIKAAPLERGAAETDCENGSLKADATFEDDDGVAHDIVVVAVDDDSVGALALDDCDVVLRADR